MNKGKRKALWVVVWAVVAIYEFYNPLFSLTLCMHSAKEPIFQIAGEILYCRGMRVVIQVKFYRQFLSCFIHIVAFYHLKYLFIKWWCGGKKVSGACLRHTCN